MVTEQKIFSNRQQRLHFHIIYVLLDATFWCAWVGWNSVEEEGGSPSLEEKGAAGEEVVDCLRLFLGGVAGQGRSNFLQLLNSNRMKTTQGLGNNGDKFQSFSSAELICTPHLVGESH